MLSVFDPAAVYVPGSAGIYAAGMGDEIRGGLAHEARKAVDELGEGVLAEWRVLDGPPARTLLGATDEGIDLLVMGSRAYGPLRTVLMGSNARQVIDHASCPVLVVPRSAATEDGGHQSGLATVTA